MSNFRPDNVPLVYQLQATAGFFFECNLLPNEAITKWFVKVPWLTVLFRIKAQVLTVTAQGEAECHKSL